MTYDPLPRLGRTVFSPMHARLIEPRCSDKQTRNCFTFVPDHNWRWI
ncbi:hypothetical protein RSAG8_02984, partial [Rhizoctonia solani AG-8 WAC10335]